MANAFRERCTASPIVKRSAHFKGMTPLFLPQNSKNLEKVRRARAGGDVGEAKVTAVNMGITQTFEKGIWMKPKNTHLCDPARSFLVTYPAGEKKKRQQTPVCKDTHTNF